MQKANFINDTKHENQQLSIFMCIFVDFHVFMEDFLLLYQKKVVPLQSLI